MEVSDGISVVVIQETNKVTVDKTGDTWKSKKVTETFWVLQGSLENGVWSDVHKGVVTHPDIEKIIYRYFTSGPEYFGDKAPLISRDRDDAVFALHSIYRIGNGSKEWRIVKRASTVEIHDDEDIDISLRLEKTW